MGPKAAGKKGLARSSPAHVNALPFFALKEQPGTAQGNALGKGPRTSQP